MVKKHKKRLLVIQHDRREINSVSFSKNEEDVARFGKNDEVLAIWSPEYFINLIEKIKFENT